MEYSGDKFQDTVIHILYHLLQGLQRSLRNSKNLMTLTLKETPDRVTEAEENAINLLRITKKLHNWTS